VIPMFACYLMLLPFPFREVMGHLAFFDRETPPKSRDIIMGFYKSCLKKVFRFLTYETHFISNRTIFSRRDAGAQRTA